MATNPASAPIYVVVLEARMGSQYLVARVWDIVKVIPCDMADIDAVWAEQVAPFFNASSTRQIDVRYIGREPDNPFKEYAGKGDSLDPATW